MTEHPPFGATTLAGTRAIVGLVVRRDRFRLLVWIASLTALMGFSARSVWALYRTPEAIDSYVGTVGDNPALVLFAGPGYGFQDPSVGAILVNETALWMGLAAALMGIFLVVRHTRAEEDSERADLIRSLTVGRHAPIVAVLLVAVAANLLVAFGSAVVTVAVGFEPVGTVALCASFGLTAICFAAAGAVAAQIAPTARSALGLATGMLGLAFVVRGVGDVRIGWLSWLTPFGWGIGVRAFAGERWWVFPALLLFGLLLLATAFWLAAHRDLGGGIISDRPGPASGAPWMLRPTGLALRLQRASVCGWAVGLLSCGLVYGSMGDAVESMLRDNPQLADYFAQLQGASVTDAYLATAVSMLGMVAGGFAIASALRARSEEASGYAELLLTTPMARGAWVRSHVALSVAGTLVVTAASGFGLGVAHAVVSGDPAAIGRLSAASVATTPAILVLVGVTTAIFGWLPRWSMLAWAAFVVVVGVGVFGEVLGLSSWLRAVSPFDHLAAMPAEDFDPVSTAVLLFIAAGLLAIGELGFVRRDLEAA